MADDTKKLKAECERLTAENATLKEEVERLKDELVRLVSRNLDLSERLEEDVEMRRRVEVARELLDGNIQRQRNADLQDDGQLMAMIELKVEKDLPHLSPDFDSNALAELLGVTKRQCERILSNMKQQGLLRRVGTKGGHWEI